MGSAACCNKPEEALEPEPVIDYDRYDRTAWAAGKPSRAKRGSVDRRRRKDSTSEWQQYEAQRKSSNRKGRSPPEARPDSNRGTTEQFKQRRQSNTEKRLGGAKQRVIDRDAPPPLELTFETIPKRRFGPDELWEICTLRRLRPHPSLTQLKAVLEDFKPNGGITFLWGGVMSEPLITPGVRPQRMKPQMLAEVASAVGSGLAWLHAQGLVHGRLTAESVLVGIDGKARLSAYSSTLTGEPPALMYRAPEQVMMSEELFKPACDMWAMGIVMWYATFLCPPFGGPSVGGKSMASGFGGDRDEQVTLQQIMEIDPEAPDKTSKPPHIAFLRGLLSKIPEDRPAACDIRNHEWIVEQIGRADQEVRVATASRSIMPQDLKQAVLPLHSRPELNGLIGKAGSSGVLTVPFGEESLVPTAEIEEDDTDDISDEAHSLAEFKAAARLPQLLHVSHTHCNVDKMTGPTPHSNWIVPGRLLMGAHPGYDDELETRLVELVGSGVTRFVNVATTKESMAYGNYSKAAQVVATHINTKTISGRNQTLTKLYFHQFQGWDLGAEAPEQDLYKLLKDLVGFLRGREVLYVHCTAGHGRSGMVCALLLAALYGLSSHDALDRINRYHGTRSGATDSSGYFSSRLSPQQVQQFHGMTANWEACARRPPLLQQGAALPAELLNRARKQLGVMAALLKGPAAANTTDATPNAATPNAATPNVDANTNVTTTAKFGITFGKRRDSLDTELGMGPEDSGCSEEQCDDETAASTAITSGPMSCNEDFFRAMMGANDK